MTTSKSIEVSDFIKDINRGRVIQQRSIMNEDVEEHDKKINWKMSLEEALPILNNTGKQTCNVIDDQSTIIGSVTMQSALDALLRDKSVTTSERYK